MEHTANGHLIVLVQSDITQVTSDAIVNAANQNLIPGAGVAGAIDRVGGPSIREESFALPGSPRCPTGSAVATGAGRLPARHVIHAVAPIWRGGQQGEPDLLRGAYHRSMELADELGDHSIAFPSLGTGVYGCPLAAAASIALSTTIDYMQGDTDIDRVTFVLFSADDEAIFTRVLGVLVGEGRSGS